MYFDGKTLGKFCLPFCKNDHPKKEAKRALKKGEEHSIMLKKVN
jgi:hypothetical protein